jgi:hypothetical protein
MKTKHGQHMPSKILDNRVTDDTEIALLPTEETRPKWGSMFVMLQPAGPQTEENVENRAGRHRVSVAKYTMLRSIVSTGKQF